jgi:SAM-dependent methyltransferase
LGTSELRHRLRAVPSRAWQRFNDWWLNVDTMHAPEDGPEAFECDGTPDYRAQYQGANYFYLEQIARLLTQQAPHALVFYDVGCGKGRPLCVMARHPFEKVVGVELRADLCEAARSNAGQLRGRVAPIEIINADAGLVDLSEGDVYFFFNPFGPPTLKRVLGSLQRSLVSAPRAITLVYYHAVHENVLSECDWLECYHLLPTFSGVRVSFWRNRSVSN